MREISSCSCLTVLPGPAWVLLSKTYKHANIYLRLCSDKPTQGSRSLWCGHAFWLDRSLAIWSGRDRLSENGLDFIEKSSSWHHFMLSTLCGNVGPHWYLTGTQIGKEYLNFQTLSTSRVWRRWWWWLVAWAQNRVMPSESTIHSLFLSLWVSARLTQILEYLSWHFNHGTYTHFKYQCTWYRI